MIQKNVLSSLLLTLILILCIAANARAASFSDVEGHWAKGSIERLTGLGVLSGRGDGIFDPNGKVTRAEFCVMLNRAFNLTATANINPSDMSPGDFYYPHIAAAVDAGYLTGYEDNTVRPNKTLTRGEAAAMLSRLLALPQTQSSDLRFADAKDIPSWAVPFVNAVTTNGIMNGYTDNTFGSSREKTRAEAAAAISNALDYYNAGRQKPPAQIINSLIIDADYGPPDGDTLTVEGDVYVKASGITIQNIIIKGDLIIDPYIGIGSLYLRNVEVMGEIYVENED